MRTVSISADDYDEFTLKMSVIRSLSVILASRADSSVDADNPAWNDVGYLLRDMLAETENLLNPASQTEGEPA